MDPLEYFLLTYPIRIIGWLGSSVLALVVFPILMAAWLGPAIAVGCGRRATGWRKAAWGVVVFVSPAGPQVIAWIWLAIVVYGGGQARTIQDVAFGPEATVTAIANISSLICPLLLYALFVSMHGKWHDRSSHAV